MSNFSQHNNSITNNKKLKTSNISLLNRYTKFGASAMFDGCENLAQEIKLEVDDKNVEVPAKLQGLIIVNLPSYAAGLNMWRGDIPEGICVYFIDNIDTFFKVLKSKQLMMDC
jgi:hypothetical protein